MKIMPLFLVLLLCTASPAVALRCGGKIVSEGDRKIEVLDACGEPTWRDVWAEEQTDRSLRGDNSGAILDELRATGVIEEWIYNFGPGRFLYVLRFRNGVLTSIDSAGRGFAPRAVVDPGVECWGEGMAKDRTKYELLHHCGKPDTVDVRYLERSLTRLRSSSEDRHTRRKVTVRVEEWTYNFGPGRLLYVFTFENGRVVDVESEGFGF